MAKEKEIIKKKEKTEENKKVVETLQNTDIQNEKKEVLAEDKKQEETKSESKNQEIENKKEDKKAEPVKKSEAIARGISVPASKKHMMYIGNFVKGKTIDKAISDLEDVLKFKKAVPFKGEIPHRKGMMSGRWPIKASKEVIAILKGLKGNALVNGMDLEKTKITLFISNWAYRPLRRGGTKAKRTNIFIKAQEIK